MLRFGRGIEAMTLNIRQRHSYGFTVNLYKPNPRRNNTRNGAIDQSWPATPTYRNVRCAFYMTRERTEPELIGLTKQNNMFVQDHYHFDIAQELDDNWLVEIVKGPKKYPDVDKFWTIQGKPKDRGNVGRRTPNESFVFAKRWPMPVLVDIT